MACLYKVLPIRCKVKMQRRPTSGVEEPSVSLVRASPQMEFFGGPRPHQEPETRCRDSSSRASRRKRITANQLLAFVPVSAPTYPASERGSH